jgi:hypothetical protein
VKQSAKTIGRTLALSLAAAALPVVSAAATSQLDRTITQTYQTTFVKQFGQSFPITGGRLEITLTNDGYVQGYYTPADSVAFIPVTGGRNGSNVWFDIGNSHATHVTGTLEPNGIAGFATTSNGVQYRFDAVTQAKPA